MLLTSSLVNGAVGATARFVRVSRGLYRLKDSHRAPAGLALKTLNLTGFACPYVKFYCRKT